MITRNWEEVMEVIVRGKNGSTGERWQRAIKDSAFDCIRKRALIETRSENCLEVLEKGTVATNVYLRRLHNFAMDMNWLLAPVLVKRLWPKPVYKDKRAITAEEHKRVLERRDESGTASLLPGALVHGGFPNGCGQFDRGKHRVEHDVFRGSRCISVIAGRSWLAKARSRRG